MTINSSTDVCLIVYSYILGPYNLEISSFVYVAISDMYQSDKSTTILSREMENYAIV